MDDVRPAAPAAKRTGSLLALALLASTALSTLPATAASTAPLVDVVVTSTGAGVAAAADAVRAAGGTVRDALPLVGGVSAELPEGAVLAPAFRVVADYPITLSGKPVTSKDRAASPIREALGLTGGVTGGAGVTIAIVDTGVAAVPDLAGRLTHVDVSGSWAAGESRDPYGHGTFVAGAAAGDGSSSGGTYAGVAPDARILDVRVADDDGSTDLATVLLGLEAAKAADIVNLSMSSGSPLPYQLDPLTTALARLVELGKVVVVPSGNDGPGTRTVTSPGVDPRLLTVGSLDEQLTADRTDDTVAGFSGRGPAPQGVAKPDLVAPGQSLVSLASPGSVVARENPASAIEGGYFRGSGTSFSTAVVAGTAALLLEKDAELRPNAIKAVLMGSTYDAAGLSELRAAGTGGLDVAAALEADAPSSVPTTDPDVPPTGEEDVWHRLLQALLDGDRAAAANSWSQLSPEAHRWAAHRWAALGPEAHRWAANSWSAHRWAGSDGSADTWQMRFWTAHRWAAHRWATDDFVAHRWAEQEYVAHRWADVDSEAHRWAAHRWAAHRWAASRWAASRWAGSWS